jgi:hypothetical protein
MTTVPDRPAVPHSFSVESRQSRRFPIRAFAQISVAVNACAAYSELAIMISNAMTPLTIRNVRA